MEDKLDLYVPLILKIDAKIYHNMVKEYGEKQVHQCFFNYISQMKKEDSNLYQCQLKVWEKFGYYLALLDHNPFEDEIVNLFEKNSRRKNKKDDKDVFYMEKQLFSCREEVYYGFHLLKKDYINIFARANDFMILNVEKVFSSIKSSVVCSYVLSLFDYLYDNCTRKSNFDDLFKKFLSEYRKLFVNGNVPDLRQIMDVRDDVEIMDERVLVEQVKMYVDYSIARDKFVLSNLSLVDCYLYRLKDISVHEREDLFSYGVMGIFRAIDTFDIRVGRKFSTYAFKGINYFILRNNTKYSSGICLPSHVKRFIIFLYKKEKQFYILNGRKPNTHELSEMLQMKEGKLIKKLVLIQQANCDSLDRIVNYGDSKRDDETLRDIVSDSGFLIEDMIQEKYDFEKFLIYMKETLTERELDILFKRSGCFDERMTLQEIGDEYGINRERVRQIEIKAIKKLRKTEYGKSFNPYQ